MTRTSTSAGLAKLIRYSAPNFEESARTTTRRPLPIMAVWPPVSPMPIKLRMLVDDLAAELAVPDWRGAL